MEILKIFLAVSILVFIGTGITPKAKPLETSGADPLLYGLTLLISFAIFCIGLTLPSPIRGFMFVVGMYMGWSTITHYQLKINFSKNTPAGFVAAMIWTAVMIPATYMIDPAAAEMMAGMLGKFWGMALFLAEKIITLILG